MSEDSLNGSPCKKPTSNNAQSPVADKTFTKDDDDDKESNLERISQVSPFLMSPTTDASAPGDSDNATRVSTLSRTTVPTDAKHSKASDCLSKATSIDSWCSNDTLYNVEENFDDLAMDPDISVNYEDKEDNSDSTETLTHHDNDRDASRCSTYIIHDSKSEPCETFTPDSITANDNYTYTKVKTEATGATTTNGNTQTKDLAYGTMPSYSNCSTEYVSGIPSVNDPWKIAQPELIRKSFQGSEESLTPPKHTEVKDKVEIVTPQIASEPCVKKMDSVELSYLRDDSNSVQNKTDGSVDQGILIEIDDNQRCNYGNDMFPSFTSTPLVEPIVDDDNVEHIPIELPEEEIHSLEFTESNIPSSQTFLQSAELRPQEGISSNCNGENVSSTQDTGLLLEADSKNLNSNHDSTDINEPTPVYTDFETLAAARLQEVNSKSSQSLESGMSFGDFGQFERSLRDRAQDLSSVMGAVSVLLNSERELYDIQSDPIVSRPTGAPENVITQPSDSITDVSNIDAIATERTPSHSDFETSTVSKLNDTHSKTIQSESGMSSGDFRQFESSVKGCPQDLSFPADSKLLSDVKVTETVDSNGECDRPIINEIVTFLPRVTNINESQLTENAPLDTYLTNLLDDDIDDETEQPHSIIITEVHREIPKEIPIRPYEITTLSSALIGHRNDFSANKNLNRTYDSHGERAIPTFCSHICSPEKQTLDKEPKVNGIEGPNDFIKEEPGSTKSQVIERQETSETQNTHKEINGSLDPKEAECNGSEKFATVNFITEPFEELLESNVDEAVKEKDTNASQDKTKNESCEDKAVNSSEQEQSPLKIVVNHEMNGAVEEKVTSVTENFLQNEKKFCQLDSYIPLLNDIRFTGEFYF